MKWVCHGGYHEIHQYVDKNGKIVGEVSGSTFDAENGWCATDEANSRRIPVGRYVSLLKAKAAVESRYVQHLRRMKLRSRKMQSSARE